MRDADRITLRWGDFRNQRGCKPQSNSYKSQRLTSAPIQTDTFWRDRNPLWVAAATMFGSPVQGTVVHERV